MGDWAEDLIESVRKWDNEFSKTLTVAERLKSLTARAANDQYGIVVTVGADCKVDQLSLSPAALKLQPRALSAEILRLARVAGAQYAREFERVNLEVLGDTEHTRRISEEIRQRFPEADAESAEGRSRNIESSGRELTSWERDAIDRGLYDGDEDDQGWRR